MLLGKMEQAEGWWNDCSFKLTCYTLIRRQSLGIRTCHIGRPSLWNQDPEEDLAMALGLLTLVILHVFKPSKAGGWKTDRFRLKLSLCQCLTCSAAWPWLSAPMTFLLSDCLKKLVQTVSSDQWSSFKVWIALDDMPLAASVRYVQGSHVGKPS